MARFGRDIRDRAGRQQQSHAQVLAPYIDKL
jgi:hypothetical protein